MSSLAGRLSRRETSPGASSPSSTCLRASTSIAVAMANGARAVVPLESSDEVVTRAKAFERSDVLLAGERKMLAIPGFDLGNSPRQFTREVVEGKTILHDDDERNARDHEHAGRT